jgi:hypothetical protein
MKVYLCYRNSSNDVDQWSWVIKVVANEKDAIEWEGSLKATEQMWNSYTEVEVE